MVRPTKTAVLVLLLAGVWVLGVAASATTAPGHKTPVHGPEHKPKAPAAPAPATPPPPPTPAELPPNPPQVSFRGGLLTIVAQNSTLADILQAVRTQTGAAIDMPAGSGRERVYFRQGPAPARDVLTALLQGSRFDYVILDSPTRPGDVQRVVLLTRQDDAPATGGASPLPEAVSSDAPGSVPAAVVPAEADEGDEPDNSDDSAPEPPPAPPEQVVPAPQQPKTPEELMQELRQLQERQQQQRQQQQQQQQNPNQPK